jgi:hypothetical protein
MAVFVSVVLAAGSAWFAGHAGATPVTSTPDPGDPTFAEGKITGYLWGDGQLETEGWTFDQTSAMADDFVRLAGVRGWPVDRSGTLIRISFATIAGDFAALVLPSSASVAHVQGWVAGVLEGEGSQSGLVYDCYRRYVSQCPWKADQVRLAWERLGAHPELIPDGTDVGTEGSRELFIPPGDFAIAQVIRHYTSWDRVPGGQPSSTATTTGPSPTTATTTATPGVTSTTASATTTSATTTSMPSATTASPTSAATTSPATTAAVNQEPDSRVTSPTAGSTKRSPVVFSGTATDDSGVVAVRAAIRKTTNGLWLQPNGSFASTFRLYDATLSAKGETSTAWSWTRSLAPGKYGLSVRAVDAQGKVESSTAWVVFTVAA